MGFIFPMDFVIMKTEFVTNLETQIPIILGRPFFATLDALINCRNNMIKLSLENMTVDLNIFNLQKPPAIFYGT